MEIWFLFFWWNIFASRDVIRRRHMALSYDTCLHNLLYVRMREGYTVKRVWFARKSGSGDGSQQHICVELRLPWKPQVSIEYQINAEWPSTTEQR